MNNPFVLCPYNSSHKVLRSRIQAHIVKCEKKYPALEICPYNATHRFPKSDIALHVADCHRKEVEVQQSQQRVMPTMTVNQHFANTLDPDYECWD